MRTILCNVLDFLIVQENSSSLLLPEQSSRNTAVLLYFPFTKYPAEVGVAPTVLSEAGIGTITGP
jgi:hypothetical protein